MSADVLHDCDVHRCGAEVAVCYCEQHFDSRIADARKEGYDEGYDDGKAAGKEAT